MSEYTPSIQELARAYEVVFVEPRRAEARAEAARAIAAHDAEKRAEWEAEQGEVTDVDRRRVIKDILHYRLLPYSVIEYLNGYLESMGEEGDAQWLNG